MAPIDTLESPESTTEEQEPSESLEQRIARVARERNIAVPTESLDQRIARVAQQRNIPIASRQFDNALAPVVPPRQPGERKSLAPSGFDNVLTRTAGRAPELAARQQQSTAHEAAVAARDSAESASIVPASANTQQAASLNEPPSRQIIPPKSTAARVASGMKDVAHAPIDAVRGLGHLIAHPYELATEPASHVITGLSPGVGEARPDPRLSKGGAPPQLTDAELQRTLNTPYDAEHGGVTPEERAKAAARAVGDIATAGSIGGKLLIPALAATGAAHADHPEDIPRSAAAMAIGGVLVHGATKVGAKGIEALGHAADVSNGAVEAGVNGAKAAIRAQGRLKAPPRESTAAPAADLCQFEVS